MMTEGRDSNPDDGRKDTQAPAQPGKEKTMTTTTDKPRRRRAPGGGRKPIGDKPFEAAIYIRLDAATRAYWRGDGERGSLSTAIRSLLTEVADGYAVVMRIDTAEHLTVAPWLAARLAEVEAQDRDDTTLEDWMRALLDALAEASRRRSNPAQPG